MTYTFAFGKCVYLHLNDLTYKIYLKLYLYHLLFKNNSFLKLLKLINNIYSNINGKY